MHLEMIQKMAKEALSEIDRIFQKNEIPFFLVAGSTLGAIRHKDMIPWDDDIDIGIFYCDANRARDALIEGLKEPYRWIDGICDPNYPRLHGKVLFNDIGVVDVFPLIKTSNSELMQRIQWAERKVFHKLYKTKKYNRSNKDKWGVKISFKNIITGFISRLLSEQFLLNRLTKVVTRYENLDNPKYYINVFSIYSLKKERIPAEWLKVPSFVELGGKTYPTVSNYDEYLHNLYGDYMKLPPIDQQKPSHPEKYGKD